MLKRPQMTPQGTPAQMANAQASADIDGVMEFSEEEIAQQNTIRLKNLYESLAGERDEWVEYRANSGIEGEWSKADNLYEGEEVSDDGSSGLEDVLRNGPSAKRGGAGQAKRSRVRINIVGPAVDNQVSRMCEILLPVDDKNWGIRPTPNSTVSDALKDQRPVQDPMTGESTQTVADIAAQVQQRAVASCKNMEREIDDQLTESRYNGECRKIIFSAGRLGTGVMKGPTVIRMEERRWGQQTNPDGSISAQMQVKEKFVPSSKSVAIWNLFPDPSCGDDIQRGKGIWEMSMMTRKELRALAKRPGYDPDAVRKVLRERPMIVQAAKGQVQKDDSKQDLYQVWEYHGETDPDDFQMVYDRSNKSGTDQSADGSDQDADPLLTYAGCLIMVNDTCIAALPMMTADNSLPYDFFQWKQSDDSPFGSGVAICKETQQRVVNSSWRQVMDNAGNSSGPQFVMKKSSISPENGRYEITANKIWLANDDLDDVGKAFAAIQIDSRVAELLKIVEAAMQFGDQESNTSPMMNGQQQQAGETLGGMTMRWTNANGVHRQRVKLFDDQITRPHLTRYYDWNMQNNEKEEIKGDYEIDARGSSTLIERDIQNQAMVNVAAMFQNPIFAPMLKPQDALKATLKSWKLDPNDFMKSEEEIEQQAQAQHQAAQQPPQPPPDLATKMQIAQMQIQDNQQQRQHELQLEGTHDQARDHQIAVQQNSQNQRLQEVAASNDTKLQVARINAETKANTALGIAQLRSKDSMVAVDSKHQLFNAQAAMRKPINEQGF